MDYAPLFREPNARIAAMKCYEVIAELLWWGEMIFILLTGHGGPIRSLESRLLIRANIGVMASGKGSSPG
jgi:hypothetical protein